MNNEYLTLDDISKRWRVSKDTVRRVFQREAGVLFVNSTRNNGANGRRKIRVPVEVYERVVSRHSNVGV